MKNLTYESFQNIDLTDEFFDSLREDYPEFEEWYLKKSVSGEQAYVIKENGIQGFVYLKIEEEEISNTNPVLPFARHLKVGTLKINPHGTLLGQRFIKKIFDKAIAESVDDVYVTVFPKHEYLVRLLKNYGFKEFGTKESTCGQEMVLVKDFSAWHEVPMENYPLISRNNAKPYLLAIKPEFHTKFLPDSKLYGESFDIVQDVSHANSIHKVYVSGVPATINLKRGDLLVMYRTTDKPGRAKFRSVATSIGVVEEVRKVSSFATEAEYMDYVERYSVYEKIALKEIFRSKKRHLIIKFSYNIALKKRLIRDTLINEVGISKTRRWDFLPLTNNQLNGILELGEINERYFIN